MKKNKTIETCVVVGAGIAGVFAARTLQEQGIKTIVLEKSRGVGGRMATRRADGGVFDHGAQFLTVTSGMFKIFAAEWGAMGLLKEWSRGFADMLGKWDVEDFPRYYVRGGMTNLPKHLSQELDVRLETKATEIKPYYRGLKIRTDNLETLVADALILTPPVPQSHALLEASPLELDPAVMQTLGNVHYDPCIALLAVLTGPSDVPPPGAIRLSGLPVAWIADNQQKGISDFRTTLTIHAGVEFSRELIDAEPEEAAHRLLQGAGKWIGSKVDFYQVHKWRYSRPLTLLPDLAMGIHDRPPIILAGDAFGDANVESSALSGIAAARMLLNWE